MVLIQTQVRGFLARAQAQRLRKAAQAKKEFDAAVLIQTRYRTLRAFSRWHELWACSQAAVVKIQACFRVARAKRIVHDEKVRLKQLEAASMQFQFRYKGHLDKRTTEHEKRARLCKAQAIVAIQALFRGHHERLVYKAARNAHEFAMISLYLALRLQANCRGNAARSTYQRYRSAVIRVQSAYRRDFAQRFVAGWRIVWTLQTASALKLQMPARFYLARRAVVRRKAEREQELVEEEAATCITSAARSFLSRQHFEDDLLREEAATCIAACARTFAGRLTLEKKRQQRKEGAVTCVQALARRVTARQLFLQMIQARELLLEQEEAVITIQSLFRAWCGSRDFLAAEVQRDDELLREEAAMCIQAWDRKVLLQWNYRLLLCTTVLVQSTWRMLPHRRDFVHKRASATRMQNTTRVALAWRRFKVLARSLQNAFVDSDDELAFEKEEGAECIQMHVRRHLARIYVRRRRRSITVVQSHARGEWARRFAARERRLAEQMEAVSAQVQFRVGKREQQQPDEPPAPRELARSLSRRQAGAPRDAPSGVEATAAQSRSTSVWKEAQDNLLLQGSAIAIQAGARGLLGRLLYRALQQDYELELLEDAAAVAFFEDEEVEEYEAATLVQSVARMHAVRHGARRLAQLRAIQSTWRAHRVRAARCTQHAAAAKSVQALVRGWLARRRYDELLASTRLGAESDGAELEQMEAAICIQTCARGFAAKQAFRFEMRVALVAAITLQAWWRGSSARVAAMHTRLWTEAMEASSCQVQFRVRRDGDDIANEQWRRDEDAEREHSHFTEPAEAFREESAAATAIQSTFRGWFDRQFIAMLLNVRAGAATKLQAFARGCHCRVHMNEERDIEDN